MTYAEAVRAQLAALDHTLANSPRLTLEPHPDTIDRLEARAERLADQQAGEHWSKEDHDYYAGRRAG